MMKKNECASGEFLKIFNKVIQLLALYNLHFKIK